MRKGKIRFPLKLKDDVEVRSLEELRENFDLEKIITYFVDGSLEKWLGVWNFTDEAGKVCILDKEDKKLPQKICDILGIKMKNDPEINTKKIKKTVEKQKKFNQIPGAENYVEIIDLDYVAFDNKELYEILKGNDTDTVFLCNNEFVIDTNMLDIRKKRYVGIGKVTVSIEDSFDLENAHIIFDNIDVNKIHESVKIPVRLDKNLHDVNIQKEEREINNALEHSTIQSNGHTVALLSLSKNSVKMRNELYRYDTFYFPYKNQTIKGEVHKIYSASGNYEVLVYFSRTAEFGTGNSVLMMYDQADKLKATVLRIPNL